MARRKAGTRASPGKGRSTKKRIARKPHAPHLGLTDARREQVIECFRRSGSLARTAAHVGVSYQTLWRWRKQDAALDAGLTDGAEQVTMRIGELARCRLEEHFESIGQVVEVGARHVIDREGAVHRLAQEELVRLNPLLAKLALGRLDPLWVMPKELQEQLKQVGETLEQMLDRINEQNARKAAEKEEADG